MSLKWIAQRLQMGNWTCVSNLPPPIPAAMVSRMTVVKAHFDGKVLIPDEPVKLPVNCALELHIQPVEKRIPASANAKPLLRLLKALEELPANDNWPADGAAQHDHYLYGLPKRR